MSGLEPKTSAKVVITTTKGPLEIELWAKEIPTSARIFIQKCLDGDYKDRRFDNLVKDLVVELESPSDECTFDIKDEYHSRIRFNRKGILALSKKSEDLANNNSCDSFFITLRETPEYNKRYIALGKVVGESLYTLANLENSQVDDNGKVMYPAKITDVSVPVKYFEDIEPAAKISQKLESVSTEPQKKKQKKTSQPRVKLAFEEDEIEEETLNIRMKSAHELLDDKKLSTDFYERKQKAETVEKRTESKQKEIESTPESENSDKEPSNSPSTQGESKSENFHEEKTPKETYTTRKVTRDPEIDSDFNSDLDLSPNEEVDLVLLHSHKLGLKR